MEIKKLLKIKKELETAMKELTILLLGVLLAGLFGRLRKTDICLLK
jgi:hypothetical protein